jgi:hypothetical protein
MAEAELAERRRQVCRQAIYDDLAAVCILAASHELDGDAAVEAGLFAFGAVGRRQEDGGLFGIPCLVREHGIGRNSDPE